MAKTKTKKPSSAGEPAAPAEPDAPKVVPASRVEKVLTSLAADQPALTAVQREAFSARYADAACEALGGKTKSESVLGDAVAWAPIMDKALRKHPAALRRYSRARFAWFLSCARALDAARAEQQGRGGAAAASKVRAQQAVFARANARNKDVPRLVPGAGTRHVLAPRAKAGKAAPANPENPEPGTP